MACSLTKLKSLYWCQPHAIFRCFSVSRSCQQSAEAIPVPKNDDSFEVSPKIDNLVNEITKLTLIEVSELNSVLKRKLNLPDAPTVAFGAAAPISVPAVAAEEEDISTQAVKTSYSVKLQKFDDSKKVALIKEVKTLLQDMNLVQAKKFIESAPVIVKTDISKEEAEKLKETLAKHGAECTID